MVIEKPAMAGTLESSDIQVMVEPAKEGIALELESSVMAQFGDQIRDTILEVLKKMDVDGVKISAHDQGALECTIRSRVQTAVLRAGNVTENLPWGTVL
ncbi:citrate lyase acyl carrier protein [Parasphaerochaeta coccoides]|uniref:Citrate lyase acyl carrier protein n=1 Tax=Parasphaerochaeta coccoides (strain ATCC BAA-1237 / DSM 17374 / SPN1) TaxID=760011 RepID=F4GLB6_PARC1|nr:citrate lyase acyl carrier protein [Parasphaerochaeta coccoides]AEC02948.1 Citrate lyase acyl carrier protein [Parasphaerochaeta coccoides DSM 17374]